MANSNEVDAMRRALALAGSVNRRTSPNPRVGSVIIDANGGWVGEGVHLGAGHPHAEVEALRAAGEAARGGTAVVTLEPCQHIGRTGPCTEALVRSGIVRVVFAQADPNPRAQGGAQVLAAAGLSVEGDLLGDQARQLNPVWSLAMERRRPYVTWKVASTVDGRVAALDGTSRWITGPQARQEVHRLRGLVDAVMVGTGTVLYDDPELTARAADGQVFDEQPVRVVVGLRDVPAAARVNNSAAQTIQLRTRSPHHVIEQLFDREIHHVLLEGGPTVAAAFLQAGLVDRAIG
ncbi:MAG: bifunctional diaminohydroxyphosphoribosylaminopyrimidine deaminase/5-amino-6-(5-phosphoribosylamino)uracil reductase RibD, partial [Actinomycetes bacterium]